MTVVLKGGRLLDASGERSGDVCVDGVTGQIQDVGPDLSGDVVLDASGCVITPGFVDLHTDVAEPGREAADTVQATSEAAAAGGYTAIVVMPRNGGDRLADLADLEALGRSAACEIVGAGTVSIARDGQVLAPLGELADHGVSLFCDVGVGIQDDLFMRRACEYLVGLEASLGRPLVLAQHCSSAALAAGGVMHEGAVSSRLGLPGCPAEAEELMVMRDITLSRLTGARVHFQSISTAGSVAMIRAAKAGGLPITAEVTPHHLLFTDESCAGFDPATKVQPPLRTAENVLALRDGLADGTIDAIASDHRPHTDDAKERPFDEASSGAVSLETGFAALHTAFVVDADEGADPIGTAIEGAQHRAVVPVAAEHRRSLAELVALLSWQPAEIAGVADRHGCLIEPGRPANLTAIDQTLQWSVDRSDLRSNARNTLFQGWTMTGRNRHTVKNGKITLENGQVQR